MIYVGIDDTDTLESRGTNHLARTIVQAAAGWTCHGVVRHQLLDDPRIPYTSHNGSASIVLTRRSAKVVAPPQSAQERSEQTSADIAELVELCRRVMRECFIVGSDPGLCVTGHVPELVTQFGWRCKQEVVTQEDARSLASQLGIHLEGLGGTEGGVIGALAAVGLIVSGNDGRIVKLGEGPDDLSGPQPVSVLRSLGVEVQDLDSFETINAGIVDVGKKLRPNRRGGRILLFARRLPSDGHTDQYYAVKLR